MLTHTFVPVAVKRNKNRQKNSVYTLIWWSVPFLNWNMFTCLFEVVFKMVDFYARHKKKRTKPTLFEFATKKVVSQMWRTRSMGVMGMNFQNLTTAILNKDENIFVSKIFVCKVSWIFWYVRCAFFAYCFLDWNILNQNFYDPFLFLSICIIFYINFYFWWLFIDFFHHLIPISLFYLQKKLF